MVTHSSVLTWRIPVDRGSWWATVSRLPGLGRSPGGGRGNPLWYSRLENPLGQRNLEGYSPQGHKELDMTEATERASTHSCFRVFSPALLNVHPQILTKLIQVPLSGSSCNIPVMILQTTYMEVQPPSPFLCNYIAFHCMYPYIMTYYFPPVLNLCIDSLPLECNLHKDRDFMH